MYSTYMGPIVYGTYTGLIVYGKYMGLIVYDTCVVGSKSFRPDILKPHQMENAVRDI